MNSIALDRKYLSRSISPIPVALCSNLETSTFTPEFAVECSEFPSRRLRPEFVEMRTKESKTTKFRNVQRPTTKTAVTKTVIGVRYFLRLMKRNTFVATRKKRNVGIVNISKPHATPATIAWAVVRVSCNNSGEMNARNKNVPSI